MKKVSALLLALSMTLSLAACGGTAPAPAPGSGAPSEAQEDTTPADGGVVLRLGVAQTDTNPYTQGANYFAEQMEARTGGRVKVEVYANGQLGQERDMTEGVSLGSLEMCLVSNAPLTNFAPRFKLFEMPYLFTSYEHAERVMDGEIGQELLAGLEDINIVGLSYFECGFRNLTNSKRAVTSPADLAGLKIRVMESDIHIAAWQALGANPTPMSWGEVYTALQQKTIDGQENPTIAIYDQKIYEVNKFLTVSEHVYTPVELIINKAVFDKLSAEDQAVMRQVAQEAAVYERQVAREINDNLESLKDEGVEISYIDKAPFQELCQSVYETYGGEISELIAGVQALQ